MKRLFLNFTLTAAVVLTTQISARADLAKSLVLDNNALYLRVGEVKSNLADEIKTAQETLAASNKIEGVVLDLRFATGSDSGDAQAAANLFAARKFPLAILVNDKTQSAATKLAAELRDSKDGLIFGSSTEIKPDIAVSVKLDDEKAFLENPFGNTTQTATNSASSQDSFLAFVDHTTEADLVREKTKDGSQPASTNAKSAFEPQKPFIRDPVLARALDFIKAVNVLRLTNS